MFRSILCGLGLMAMVVACGNKNKGSDTMSEVTNQADVCGADVCGADACGADACSGDPCAADPCGEGNPCDDWSK